MDSLLDKNLLSNKLGNELVGNLEDMFELNSILDMGLVYIQEGRVRLDNMMDMAFVGIYLGMFDQDSK